MTQCLPTIEKDIRSKMEVLRNETNKIINKNETEETYKHQMFFHKCTLNNILDAETSGRLKRKLPQDLYI